MNCEEANQISIISFLVSFGFEPKNVKGNNHWYISPFRDENTPSFKVDASINRWYDHGIGVGGKLVDLEIRIFEIDIAEFLEKMGDQNFSNSFSFQKQKLNISLPVIKKVKKLENKALLSYLTDRAIDLKRIPFAICKEVYFSTNSKNYFGIGIKN